MLILLALTTLPDVEAEQKIIKSNISITYEDNKIKIDMEDIDAEIAIPINSTNFSTTYTHTIEIVRDLQCDQFVLETYIENLTALSSQIRNCGEIYETNGKNSVMLASLRGSNDTLNILVDNLTTKFSQCEIEKNGAQSSLSSCNYRLGNLTTTLSNSQTWKGSTFLYVVLALIAGGLIVYFSSVKPKKDAMKNEITDRMRSGGI